MDRRSRSIESPRRHRNGGNSSIGSRYNRRSSRSRSRDCDFRRRNSKSRSRERVSHYRRGNSIEKDLYRDIIDEDYHEEKYASQRGYDGRQNRVARMDDVFNEERERWWHDRPRDKGRDYERDQRDRDFDRERDRDRDRRDYRHRRHDVGGGGGSSNRRYNSADREHDRDSDDSEESYNNCSGKTPSNTIIVMGLQPHITEADITSSLIQVRMAATSIRLIRKRVTGASRGFAFVEFNTIDEAALWMDLTQGALMLPDQTRASLQYSQSQEQRSGKSKTNVTDWYCGKCGVFNFKRRGMCFKCYASREESEKGGEGSDEVSNILTKKIMLRNLDVLTNEEGVLTAMQQLVPDLAKKINKILVSRDVLTQTSRGMCYLNFESLVDSMNLHNALTSLDPPLKIDNREIIVTYCIDHENRQIVPKKANSEASSAAGGNAIMGPLTAAEMAALSPLPSTATPTTDQYTLNDVPRLAEYSAAMYASTPAEHTHYYKYYTEYYISEINKGQFGNLPSNSQVSEASANSGAAVALSAIQRKQKKMNSIETTATAAAAQAAQAAAMVKAAIAAQNVITPKGNDGKTYPTPDVSLYQYDETSGYYYDPTTGLYYDAHSQYYYNNETGAYLYWDQRKSSYVLATPAAAAASVQDVLKKDPSDDARAAGCSLNDDNETKKEKKDGNKHDKVKVAKKIVKDMEKWAKQLNQKKDYTAVATPQPILTPKSDEIFMRVPTQGSVIGTGYADVGFSILEKKERVKLTDYLPTATNKLVSAYGSDSEDEHAAAPSASGSGGANALMTKHTSEASEKDYVDFQKLTCLLCKRAFQSLDILQKHLKMSNLHKENLQKYNVTHANADSDLSAAALSYRDRAKERRLKYGESDPPPPNRSRERFENEIKSLTSRQKEAAPALPIGSNNVGNRLLQKMGWSEGQGLGRKNQGRTNIIEANARSSTAGLGTKSGIGPGDDYKTYIKKMMKSRYESV